MRKEKKYRRKDDYGRNEAKLIAGGFAHQLGTGQKI